jgi:hypothetical protein
VRGRLQDVPRLHSAAAEGEEVQRPPAVKVSLQVAKQYWVDFEARGVVVGAHDGEYHFVLDLSAKQAVSLFRTLRYHLRALRESYAATRSKD